MINEEYKLEPICPYCNVTYFLHDDNYEINHGDMLTCAICRKKYKVAVEEKPVYLTQKLEEWEYYLKNEEKILKESEAYAESIIKSIDKEILSTK